MRTIRLAGGCFWGVEAYFQQLKGVLDTTVGYGQGSVANPSYELVCTGLTGHAEICEVVYDEQVLPLTTLLEHFFRIIDPTARNRQGPDVGTQYRTGIYYLDEQEHWVINDFLATQAKLHEEPLAVEVEPAGDFYPAEAYHQDYLQKNPHGYCHVNLGLAKAEEKKNQ